MEYLISAGLYFAGTFFAPLTFGMLVVVVLTTVAIRLLKEKADLESEEREERLNRLRKGRRLIALVLYPALLFICLAFSAVNPQYTYKHDPMENAVEQAAREAAESIRTEAQQAKDMVITLEGARTTISSEERESHFDKLTDWKGRDDR